jgi:hypothetical protein
MIEGTEKKMPRKTFRIERRNNGRKNKFSNRRDSWFLQSHNINRVIKS